MTRKLTFPDSVTSASFIELFKSPKKRSGMASFSGAGGGAAPKAVRSMPLGMISALTSFTCFRDFLIMGCGFSSSSEKARVRGSKSRPDDAIENAEIIVEYNYYLHVDVIENL